MKVVDVSRAFANLYQCGNVTRQELVTELRCLQSSVTYHLNTAGGF